MSNTEITSAMVIHSSITSRGFYGISTSTKTFNTKCNEQYKVYTATISSRGWCDAETDASYVRGLRNGIGLGVAVGIALAIMVLWRKK